MNHKDGDLNHPRIEALIRELSQLMGPDAKPGMFEEIFTDLALIGREHQDFGDHKLIHKALGELRKALKMFLPHRDKRKVAIFGSSRIGDSHPNYKLALEPAPGVDRPGLSGYNRTMKLSSALLVKKELLLERALPGSRFFSVRQGTTCFPENFSTSILLRIYCLTDDQQYLQE